jgi:hypothetical protein
MPNLKRARRTHQSSQSSSFHCAAEPVRSHSGISGCQPRNQRASGAVVAIKAAVALLDLLCQRSRCRTASPKYAKSANRSNKSQIVPGFPPDIQTSSSSSRYRWETVWMRGARGSLSSSTVRVTTSARVTTFSVVTLVTLGCGGSREVRLRRAQ